MCWVCVEKCVNEWIFDFCIVNLLCAFPRAVIGHLREVADISLNSAYFNFFFMRGRLFSQTLRWVVSQVTSYLIAGCSVLFFSYLHIFLPSPEIIGVIASNQEFDYTESIIYMFVWWILGVDQIYRREISRMSHRRKNMPRSTVKKKDTTCSNTSDPA